MNRATDVNVSASRGLFEARVGRDLNTIRAACATVANRRSGATGVVIVLGGDAGSGALMGEWLSLFEWRYGVRIRVLDEGSLDAPPTLRITPKPESDVDGGERAPWRGALAWLRRHASIGGWSSREE